MKRILVTGGAGFIGSNFIRYYLEHYNCERLVNLDLLTYAGNLENLSEVEKDRRYSFVKGDIRDRQLLSSLFEKYNFDTVVNFAAESHVDRSIINPDIFLATNILGTQVLLESAKQAWKLFPQDKYSCEYQKGVRFLQISTDEVYGALGKDGKFTEISPLSPSSPYSASKASADMIVSTYYKTYGLPANITRCSNNYGPFQFPEKLIPLMINNAIQDKPLPVYGDGMQIRDWLYVEDHCTAICAVLEKGTPGEVYNVGGNNEKTNLEIIRLILGQLNKPLTLITNVQDRPGHDRRYAIDNSKITQQLGWKPKFAFEEGIKRTIQWYTCNNDWLEHITTGTYADYYKIMYGA